MSATLRPTSPPRDRVPRPAVPTALAVTVLPGDGIGPEVVTAARRVVDAAGARIAWDEPDGAAAGAATGLPRATRDSIERTGLVLQGPLAPPAACGGLGARLTLRRSFDAHVNLRPVRELPGMPAPFTGRGIDVVIVRETGDDLSAAIEHLQTPDVAQALRLVTRPGCERVARAAFDLAGQRRGRSAHCATRADVATLTEGMMLRTFDRVAAEYPHVAPHRVRVDHVIRQLVAAPEQFDVIVATQMNGSVIGDVAAALVGGPAVVPSADVGDDVAIFEAAHGPVPALAGRDLANPTALILAAAMLLRHAGDHARATAVERAVAAALSRGARTADVPGAGEPVGTAAFADAVIAALEAPAGDDARPRLGIPCPAARRRRTASPRPATSPVAARTVGVDVFIRSEWSPEQLGESLKAVAFGTRLALRLISNRGVRVYPSPAAAPTLVDHYRCRFTLRNADAALDDRDLLAFLQRVSAVHRWVHLEKLQSFGGEPGFSRAPDER